LSDRLENATHEVEQVVPDLQEIVRVDVDDAGELMLTALCPGGTRWFTHDDRGLIERYPERDEELPLSARLREASDWRVLSYRPGRRAVVVVSRGERVNVFKGHKRSRSARAAVHQGCAEGAMRRGAFRVPRLIGRDGQHEALVFEFLAAREVELDSASTALYHTLGGRLAVFQGDECAPDLKVFGPSDELAVLERWKAKVLRAVPALPEGWSEASARLERCAAALPPPRLGLCHRDLHDRQVHFDGSDVALLDFDLLCRADVALDPGNLIAHLRWRALQGLHGADEISVRALEDAFLAGYARGGEQGFETRLAFYRASAFLRLALVYRLRPRWSGRVGELVSRASRALDDLAPSG
jgi:hypothetical protein